MNNNYRNIKKPEINFNSNPTYQILKRLFFAFPLVIIIGIIIKSLFLGAYKIPTSSMENSLVKGDFIMVNKFIYGGIKKIKIPFINNEIFTLNLPKLKDPQIGDIIIFDLPNLNKNEFFNSENSLVKRCVALPGDTLQIINDQLFVNKKEIYFDKVRLESEREKFDFDTPGLFSFSDEWTKKNYGPIIIPKKGTEMKLDLKNIHKLKSFILNDADNEVTLIGSSIYINNVETKFYKVKKDYYFVLGDNRNMSFDSRYFGFVQRQNIVGKVLFIYWSWDLNSENIINKISSIRIKRLFNSFD